MTPRGRTAVRRALLDAAAQLFASRGAAAVSVRDIAAAARVNHGLVHRHFGSKDKLRREVMIDLTRTLAEETDLEEPDPSTFALVSPVMDRYWRMLARALLDGTRIDELQSSFPVVKLFLTSLEQGQADGTIRDDIDARLLAALGVASGLGWLLFEPFVVAALGLKRRKALAPELLKTWFALTQPP